MSTELIKKLRGAERWPEVVATVYSSEVVSDGGYKQAPPSVRVTFSYRDEAASTQSGSFVADSLTSLYSLRVGDTFAVRVNPRRPADFYVGELDTAFTQMALFNWIGLVVVIALSLAVLVWR